MSVYDFRMKKKSVNFLKRRKSRFILALTRQLTACMLATLLL